MSIIRRWSQCLVQFSFLFFLQGQNLFASTNCSSTVFGIVWDTSLIGYSIPFLGLSILDPVQHRLQGFQSDELKNFVCVYAVLLTPWQKLEPFGINTLELVEVKIEYFKDPLILHTTKSLMWRKMPTPSSNLLHHQHLLTRMMAPTASSNIECLFTQLRQDDASCLPR